MKEKSIVKNIDIDPQYRFSLTDVVLNGIEVAETCFDDCILVWCTCDILLEPNFFQILVNHYKRGFAGIVHPNIIYKSLDDLENDKGKFGPVGMGIDLLFLMVPYLKQRERMILKNIDSMNGEFLNYFLLRYQKCMLHN